MKNKNKNTQASPHAQLVDVKFLFKVFFGEIYWIPVLRENRQHKRERKIVLLKTLIDHHPPPPPLPSTILLIFTQTHSYREMHSDRTHSDNRKHARTHTHPGSSITVATPPVLHCDWMSGWPSVATCWPIDFASQCGPTQCRDVCLFSVLSDTHLLSPTHTQKYTYSALLLVSRLVLISASVVSFKSSLHFFLHFLLFHFFLPPFLHLSLTHKPWLFIFYSQIAFFLSLQSSLNVSSCHTPPIASPPVPLLPPPQLKTLMTCQLLPSFSLSNHTTISPFCPSLLFLPSLLWTSHSFITLVYSVASGYTTLLSMLYCCLLSFIYSLLPSPLPLCSLSLSITPSLPLSLSLPSLP